MNNELNKLAEAFADKVLLATKEVLTTDEVCRYTGLAKSYIYKLTSTNQIPFYKPFGKGIYFNRKDIERWLMQNRQQSEGEVKQAASHFCRTHKMMAR